MRCLDQPRRVGLPTKGRAKSIRLPCVVSFQDFDHYVEEHGIPEENYPAAIALWLAEVKAGPSRGSRRCSLRSRRTGP